MPKYVSNVKNVIIRKYTKLDQLMKVNAYITNQEIRIKDENFKQI